MPSWCRAVYVPSTARTKSVIANGIALFIATFYEIRDNRARRLGHTHGGRGRSQERIGVARDHQLLVGADHEHRTRERSNEIISAPVRCRARNGVAFHLIPTRVSCPGVKTGA